MNKSVVFLAIASIVGTGCGGGRLPRPTAEDDGRPAYADVNLTVACPSALLAEKLKPFATGWAARTRATVTFIDNPDVADVVVLTPEAFGSAAARGSLLPVPDTLSEPVHPFQWSNLFSERLITWGAQARGIPLGTGADVLVYRNDVSCAGRPLTPAGTWEQLLEQAEALSREKPREPVFPPLPTDDGALLHQFHSIAAGYDRQAVPQHTNIVTPGMLRQSSTFHHDLTTGAPRLREASFVTALTLMKRMQAYRPEGKGDIAAAFKGGRVKLAVVSLSDLGRISAAFDGRIPDAYTIAQAPGTRQCLDPETRKMVPAKNGVNPALYLGDTGFVGAVRTTCANPAAAFDLLAELGGPVNSLKLVADPTLGFGPWRQEHTDPTRRDVWNGYGLSPAQMSKLITAVKYPYSGVTGNPVVAPRSADTKRLMEALARNIRTCLTGPESPEAALAATEAEWEKIDAESPPGVLLKARREAAGLPPGT